MTIVTELQADINQILNYGEQLRFKYYNLSFGAGSYYDDDTTLTQSGSDLWTSGLILPIDSRMGGYDALLLQQGELTVDDKKIYVLGTIQTSGLGPVKIGIGSPELAREYQILEEGHNIQWTLNGSPVYKKIYVRFLPTGSFVGD